VLNLLGDFIGELRAAGIPISMSEHIDSAKAMEVIDLSDRSLVKNSLAATLVKDGDQVMLITDRGQTIRMCVDEIRETSRNAQGVRLMTLADGERIVAVERLAESEAVDDGTGSMLPPPPDGGSVPPPPPSELN